MKLEIPGRLPGLNEIIDAAKQGKGKYQPYAMMKEHYTTMIAWLAKKLPKYEKVGLLITWHEPDRRRDPDNITAGQKFILEGWWQLYRATVRNIEIFTGLVDRKNPHGS